MAPAGTSWTTTALAPIWAPSPITTLFPTVGCRLPCVIDLPPRVVPWKISTSSPTTAVSPMTTPMPWSINRRRPMVAPGWISIPVAARVSCESKRASSRSPGWAHLERREDGRTRRDPDEQALLGGGRARGGDRVVAGHVDDLVVDRGVQDLGDEVRAEALDLVRTRCAAVEDRRLGRLDGDDLHAGLALLEHLTDAGDRPAGADAGDEDVDLAVGVRPDLLGGRLAVDLRVRLVGELTGQHGTRSPGGDLGGAVDGALHAGRTGGQHELGAEGPEQGAPLLGHGLGPV